MTGTDYATDITLRDLPNQGSPAEGCSEPSKGSSKPLKGLSYWFAATVTVGLALASWYLGARIVSANAAARSRPLPSAIPLPAVPTQAPTQGLYLQVGALGPQKDVNFANSLEQKGLPVHLEAPAGDRDERILIGPFATRAELELAEQNLRSAGVLAAETTY
jgi:SPOR domain